jgi:hypothetical protein
MAIAAAALNWRKVKSVNDAVPSAARPKPPSLMLATMATATSFAAEQCDQ